VKGRAEEPWETWTLGKHHVTEGMETTFLSLFLLAPMKSFNPTTQQRHFGEGAELSFTDHASAHRAERLPFLEPAEKFMEYLQKTQTNPTGIFKIRK